MSAKKYTAGTEIAYIEHHSGKLVEDKIWLVREGYYHMPSDDYLHDENIIGAVVEGKRVENDLFTKERKDSIARATKELRAAEQWSSE
jgi:hypothetical protein